MDWLFLFLLPFSVSYGFYLFSDSRLAVGNILAIVLICIGVIWRAIDSFNSVYNAYYKFEKEEMISKWNILNPRSWSVWACIIIWGLVSWSCFVWFDSRRYTPYEHKYERLVHRYRYNNPFKAKSPTKEDIDKDPNLAHFCITNNRPSALLMPRICRIEKKIIKNREKKVEQNLKNPFVEIFWTLLWLAVLRYVTDLMATLAAFGFFVGNKKSLFEVFRRNQIV